MRFDVRRDAAFRHRAEVAGGAQRFSHKSQTARAGGSTKDRTRRKAKKPTQDPRHAVLTAFDGAARHHPLPSSPHADARSHCAGHSCCLCELLLRSRKVWSVKVSRNISRCLHLDIQRMWLHRLCSHRFCTANVHAIPTGLLRQTARCGNVPLGLHGPTKRLPLTSRTRQPSARTAVCAITQR